MHYTQCKCFNDYEKMCNFAKFVKNILIYYFTQHDFKLGQDVTLGMFVPRDGRYLRLSPQIVYCFQSVVIAEQKLEVGMYIF